MDGRNDALRLQYPAVGEFHARDAPAFGVERACPASGEDRAAVLADSGRQRVGDMLRPAGETAGAFDVRMVYHGVVVERRTLPHAAVEGVGPGQNAAQQRVGDAFADELRRRCAEVFHPAGRQPSRTVHFDAYAVSYLPDFVAVAGDSRRLAREEGGQVPPELVVAVHVGELSGSARRYDVERFVERPYFERIPDAEIVEIAAHDAALLHAAHVVHPRVDGMAAAAERLQAAAGDRRLFDYADAQPFAAQHDAAFQSAQPAADDDYVEFLLHLIPVGSVCKPYSTCARPCAPRGSPAPACGPSAAVPASR